MYERFLPLLTMTFFICLFIVLMQFLFVYIDEMVGKGLELKVIGELFFYAALSMVPTALPLAVLLASLMTFGNLGEKFELTALKAAGISLIRIMKPLIWLMVVIAIGAFFFQNDVLPIAQTKMWTLLFSMRQKSPEVEIPVKAFYDQIPGINLYVEKKNPETGVLYDMIIYDVSRGLDNSRVILADSGKLNFTEDKTHLYLHLYHGEMFENLRDNALGNSSKKFLPFRRESFIDKQIYLTFDANFNRIDENSMRKQYIGKNIKELSTSIDSIKAIVDSIGTRYGTDLQRRDFVNVPRRMYEPTEEDGTTPTTAPTPVITAAVNYDSLFAGATPSMQKSYITGAISKARQNSDEYQFRSAILADQSKLMRRHGIEMHKKFTLSFAVLVFFFIGAPLGAIIKKGGIGTPLVISVLLFIFYYIIDNFGFKMARDGKVEVWEGIWLSSAVLLPLGIFFTYKAVGDSAVFDIDSYKRFFNRLIGKQPQRSLEKKEVIMNEIENDKATEIIDTFLAKAKELSSKGRKHLIIDKLLNRGPFNDLETEMNAMIDYLSNTRKKEIILMLNQLPFDINYKNLPNVINTGNQLRDYFEKEKEAEEEDENQETRDNNNKQQ